MKTDLISIEDLSKQKILDYIRISEEIEKLSAYERSKILAGKLLGVLFFEPSTRTRLSFEAAMLRIGGQVIGFAEVINSSVAKGESLADTIRTVEQYCDAIVIRHPREGAARLAAEVSRCPLINAGDGANQHPTQTLLDLLTIKKLFGQFDSLRIALVGDLKYSRTVHSLFHALIKFENIQFVFVAPDALQMPDYVVDVVESDSLQIRRTDQVEEAILDCDVLYMTRIQRERFPDPVEYEKVKDAFHINKAMLKKGKENLKVLHPLPRINEVNTDVDDTDYAAYFLQARNGMIMRQGILAHLLKGKI